MSLAELRVQNKTWTLARFRLLMARCPQNGDAATVETWASTRTPGIRAVRKFHFLDSEGALLGTADSIIIMMDVERKRPVRLPQVVLDLAYAERSDPEEFEIPRLRPAGNVWGLAALPLEVNRDRHLAQLDIEFWPRRFTAMRNGVLLSVATTRWVAGESIGRR
jgi:hypothetical protein